MSVRVAVLKPKIELAVRTPHCYLTDDVIRVAQPTSRFEYRSWAVPISGELPKGALIASSEEDVSSSHEVLYEI
jgi:hypothetical protein